MEPSTASNQALADTDDYLLFDPRATRGRVPTASGAGKGRQQYQEGVVFVVGGGGYVEYGNIMEWAARSTKEGGGGGKRVTYGSTEIISPVRVLGVLADLGA